jgi:segregation and condensation protein A
MSSSSLEGVLGHLMFHKALIDETDRHQKLDRYLSLAQAYEQGDQVVPQDPVEKSLQMVFDLVLSNNYDPWDIDLISFTDLYLRKMQHSEVNFIVAGKLVFMAWSILKMQSEEVLAANDEKQQMFCSDWDFDAIEDMLAADDDQRFAADVPDQIDLCEAVHHQSQRPVSLVELLDAFEEARAEAEIADARAKIREQLKVVDQKYDPRNHSEDLEKDVEIVWSRIMKCGNGPIVIDDIFSGDKEDRVTVFISLLFLARNGKIALWQEDLPYGQIFMEIKIPWDIGTLEDARAVEAKQAPVM